MTLKFAWHEWKNPLDVKLPRRKRETWQGNSDHDHDEDDEDGELALGGFKIVETSLGIMPYDSTNSICNQMKIVVMETNFKVTKRLFNLIDDTDGVETLHPITQYRQRIAFGRLFDADDVKERIEHQITKILEPPARLNFDAFDTIGKPFAWVEIDGVRQTILAKDDSDLIAKLTALGEKYPDGRLKIIRAKPITPFK